MCAAGIGTETDGSIVCPSSVNGIVGIKPTLGLVSRAGIIPIAHSQDTAGPMARTVRDAALLLQIVAGYDAGDPVSAFGGVVALTREVDAATAEGLASLFLEVVVAPDQGRQRRSPQRLEAAYRTAFAQNPPGALRLGKAGKLLRPEIF
jgi:Asp-tRNA(Asn)/Glu-tRNA(Gln) amidotransferase A subunit family amidase